MCENIGPQIPMLLATVFGSLSMLGDIELPDLSFPREPSCKLPGPRCGLDGVRDLLGVPEHPLLNTMIEFDRNRNPLRDDLLVEAPALIDGRVPVPQGPGLGVDIDEAVLRNYCVG